MTKNILAIIAIFLCTSAAWAILGATIMARTYSAGNGLGARVESTWGSPQQQTPPQASTSRTVPKLVQETVNGRPVTRSVDETIVTPLALEQSRIKVDLDLEQRQKGLLWFPTYRVGFRGNYLFRNTTASDDVDLRLVFPVPDAIYDELTFRVNGVAVPTNMAAGAVTARLESAPDRCSGWRRDTSRRDSRPG
ncbi:MAG: hypothetical protein ACXW2P_12410, partial [Thermoanaerobaculia bacterium]